MRRVGLWVLVAAILGVVASTDAADGPAVADRQEGKVVDTTAFAADLYARLAAQSKDNLFFSPTSIETALAMTYAGARGNTAAQMAKTLHFENDAAKVSAAFAKRLQILNNPPAQLVMYSPDESGKSKAVMQSPYQLFVANALWGQQGYPFKPDFIDLVQKNFGGGLNNVDFAGHTEETRKTINDWAAKQTKDRIKDLIAPGLLTPLTRLVLTNAIYFKSNWEHSFTKALTKDGPFHLSADKSVNVPLMHQTNTFAYGENEELQFLSMPYTQDVLSMVVLLPRQADGLAALEKKLTAENLDRWLKNITAASVEITFPKYTFSSEFQLKDILSAMGMPDAFDDGKADFSGMTTAERLFISAVVHKAFVAVDEEGTEAAAATAVIMAGRAALLPQEPKVFKADHPFIFLIRHNATGEILFLGRIVNPTGQ
ncbi:MAG: serpin family protein [Phycisphaerales bacterium]|nr:serpin family protein [Phycisphaerales bacterium]